MQTRVVSTHRNGADSMPVLQIPVLEPKKNPQGVTKRPIKERFLEKFKVNPNTGCWEWTGYHGGAGYAKMKINGKTFVASRVSYMLFKGDIPEGLVVDHLCRIRHCVNPDHLEAISNYENTIIRGVSPLAKNASKPHCKRGHEFTKRNTYLFAHKKGMPKTARACRVCRKINKEKSRAIHVC